MRFSTLQRFGICLVPALLAALTGGCTTVAPGANKSLAGLLGGKKPVADAKQQGTYTVDIKPLVGKAKTKEFPMTQVTRVQDALAAAGALRRFNNVEIKVIRPTSDPSSPPIVMGSTYSTSKRQVSIETDYALRPGDRVVVKELSPFPKSGLSGSLTRVLGGGR